MLKTSGVSQAIGLAVRSPVQIQSTALARELVDRCADLLLDKSWPERLRALMEMHDQLRDDIEDFAVFCEVFPLFIQALIERLGISEIECLEQAHIYANSADEAHRQAAGAWMRRHNVKQNA